MKNSMILVLAALILCPILSFSQTTTKIAIKGKGAEKLARALLLSGFNAETDKNGVRTLKVDALVTKIGIAQHECDDEESVICGFNLPAGIQTATQNGNPINVEEEVQLTETLGQLIDPIFAAKGIENTESGMGRSYEDYGKITCTWKVLPQSHFPIAGARCVVEI